MIRRKYRDSWPGLNLGGLTLAELRRRVREPDAVGTASTTPPATEPSARRPEHISAILERMDFVKGQGDDRNQ
jgi:hypothetical protein